MFPQLTVEVTLNVGVDRAWQAFTDPEAITKWNFADPSWWCPSASNDLRVGGLMRSRMEARDGSFGFDFEGQYSEVVPLKRLAYGLADGRQVAIDFVPVAGGTRVIETFDAEAENPLEMQKGGWQSILNNYQLWAEGRL